MKNLLELLSTDQLFKYVEMKNYHKNEIIFSEGVMCNYIGIVLEGKILISTITYNNNEEVINLLDKNQIFGNNLIFSKSPIFLGNVISQMNSKIAFISKNNLKKIFKENEEFLYKYIEIISNHVLEEKYIIKLLVHKNIRDRILYYLNHEQKKKGHVKIKSIADLARTLSLPRPSVSREIYKLINENIIKYENKTIILK